MSCRPLLALLSILVLSACASPPPASTPDPGPPPPPPAQSLTEVVADADDLTVFATLLSAANLTAALDLEETFTVFAPSNEAFAAFPAGTVEGLLAPDRNHELVALLSHHIVPGRLASSDLRSGQTLRTVGGTTLQVRTTNGILQIHGATMIATNVEAGNGLLHVMDTVLTP
ncbi:MAG: fasciclin domain-containing protein [Rubricoccaceae bacterium]